MLGGFIVGVYKLDFTREEAAPILEEQDAQDCNFRVCGDCAECPVKCSVGFDVSRKIRDVIRLRDVPAEFIA